MTVRQVTISQFQKILLQLAPKLEARMVRGLRSTALRLKVQVVEEILRSNAVATGELSRSVRVVRHEDGAEVLVDAPHAAFVEYGTRPHMPPVEPLIDWVMDKGWTKDRAEAEDIAWAVARKIERDGTDPVGYFEAAWKRVVPTILRQEIKRELSKP